MSPNRRIFLNIIVTYGRSLYALVIGLFCGRWALMALGEVDYGLMGVVGGLTAFINFFFGILSGAVGRFYAFAIGEASVNKNQVAGLERCRQWFSLAVTIHSIIPIVLMIIGYPIGEWAVRNFLTIPADRVDACVWVFRFVCISCFLGMVTVPFNAMYVAKQYIAELTIYSFVTSTLNVIFLYYMVTHPGVWLARYAFWQLLLILAPQLIIAIRAHTLFPECRFRRAYAWNWSMYKQMLAYTGWNIFGSLGHMLKGQGIAVLVNKYYGPAVNAAMNIANTVSGQTQTLSGAMQSAFTPAITTAAGTGDYGKVRALAFRFCKFGMLLSLIFMLPLALELPEVMRLWLKTPPAYATGLCWMMLLIAFIDSHTLGLGVAIMAKGDIKWYQIVLGGFNLLALPLAWIFAANGGNVYAVALGILIAWAFLVYGRVLFARRLIGVSVRLWLKTVMLPVLLVLSGSGILASIPHYIMPESYVRVVVTTVVSTIVFLPLAWCFALDFQERSFICDKVRRCVYHG